MTFTKSKQMYYIVVSSEGELFNPETGDYVVTSYSGTGIYVYNLTKEKVKDICVLSRERNLPWHTFLGFNRKYYKDPYDYLDNHYLGDWYECENYEWILRKRGEI